MTPHKSFLFAFISFCVFAQGCLAPVQTIDALIVVDIDHTLGEQSNTKPSFSHHNVAVIEDDKDGSFYFYDGALDFMRELFKFANDAKARGKDLRIALFTMASGQRNQTIRNFIEDNLGLLRGRLAVYDYSNAVFAEDLVSKWRAGDATLSEGWKSYLDSLEKPLYSEPLPSGTRYFKDLSRLVPFYNGLRLENIRLVDDNENAVPASQKQQHFIYEEKLPYAEVLTHLRSFIDSL